MKHLKPFKSFLNEKNKTVEFFQANRDKLPLYSAGIEPGKEEWDPTRMNVSDNKSVKMDKFNSAFVDKIQKLDGGDSVLKFAQNEEWPVANLLLGHNDKSNWRSDSWYNAREYRENIVSSGSFDKFAEYTTRYPGYDKRTLDELPELRSFIESNWDNLVDIMKWYIKGEKSIKGAAQLTYENSLLKMGVNPVDVSIAMSHVQNWTSMSYKRLNPKTWELLRKISVDPSLLPTYIYRGIFYDGKKIKDKNKWLEKWKPGSKPGASQGKATSWTIDRKTASNFMGQQDNVLDGDNGYFMLLRWKVDPDLVIADLRNLPVDHKFWNQQEIIVSPKARDYEIDTMIPGNDYAGWRKFVNDMKGGQSAYGISKSDYVQNFMEHPYDTLDNNEKIEFKQISKMTFAEFKENYPMASVSKPDSKFSNIENAGILSFPLLMYVNNNMTWFKVDRIVNKSEIHLSSVYGLNYFYYSQDKMIKELFNEAKEKYNFNQYAGTDFIEGQWKVSLQKDSYYDIELTVAAPKKFQVVSNKKTPRDIDVPSNDGLEYIFSKLGNDAMSKILLDDQKSVIKHLSSNIKVNLK